MCVLHHVIDEMSALHSAIAALVLSVSATAVADSSAAHGFPALRDKHGKTLADGEYTQWTERGRLHVKVVYRFPDGRRIEEKAILREDPVAQDYWSWTETRDKVVLRRFTVDLRTGEARGEKLEEDGDRERWSKTHDDVEPGKTFAGIGFAAAIVANRKRLVAGDDVRLQVAAFTPKPRLVDVELTYRGIDTLRMGGRKLRGERYVIHPKVPDIAELFVDAPDTTLWMTYPPPTTFLRMEGPLLEPKDPRVRVDLLPGGKSEPARPLRAARD